MIYKATHATINSAALFIMIYIITFVRFEYFALYNVVKYLFIVMSALFLLINFRIVFKKKYLKINLLMLLFCAVVIYSSWVNKGVITKRSPLLASIVFCAVINLVLYAAEFAVETRQVRLMLIIFFLFCTFNNIITDILIISVPSLYDNYSGCYFIGNKFSVVFAHSFMTVLYLCIERFGGNKALKLFIGFLMLLWTLLIAIIVKCATGIVGCFAFALLLIIQINSFSFCSKKILLISAGIVIAFPFVSQIVLSLPASKSIINLFDRSQTMGSRQWIYAFSCAYILNSPVIGFGYGTSYEMGQRLKGFPDTQNCFLEWIWQSGIVGTSLLLIFLLAVVSVITKNSNSKGRIAFKVIVSSFFTYFILGTIEITFNEMFFGVTAIMLALGLSDLSLPAPADNFSNENQYYRNETDS